MSWFGGCFLQQELGLVYRYMAECMQVFIRTSFSNMQFLLCKHLPISQQYLCRTMTLSHSKTGKDAKISAARNAAARIQTRTRTTEHIAPILESLHWLTVRFHTDFKILTLMYKALHGLPPNDLSEHLTVYTPRRDLRSSDSGLVPSTNLCTMVDRAFLPLFKNSGSLFL